MNRPRAAGFTLIELLVVIGILSLLVVTFAPDLIGAWSKANQTADAEQLRKHFGWVTSYRYKFGRLPPGGGHKFILETWIKEVVERTPQNMERFFTPGLRDKDEHYQDLRKQDPATIWTDAANVTSEDTHYAGRGRTFKMDMESGNEAWMANDNEGYWSHTDGTINVLYGDGVVRPLHLQEELKELGWTKDQGPFPVGPDSPHAQLRKLEY